MAIILKPRSNKQGIVETTADLANIEGRENYTVLVKDTGVFEWLDSGLEDSENIFSGKAGVWSRIIQSGEGSNISYTAENISNKSISVTADAASDVKYPSVKATKTYADSLVVGLLNDRGNFTPGVSSPGAWPTTGGSGTAGAIKKGDLWFCAAGGFLGTTAVVTGTSFRALVDTPGQTAANWNVLDAGLGFTPENVANKSTSTTLGTSNTLYPTQNAVKVYVDGKSGLPYKSYVALLSKSGASVTATQLYNTIGDGSGDGVNDITWTNPSNSVVMGVMSTGSPFTAKTFIVHGAFNNAGTPYFLTGRRNPLANTTEVELTLFLHDGTKLGNPNFTNLHVEIRVYP